MAHKTSRRSQSPTRSSDGSCSLSFWRAKRRISLCPLRINCAKNLALDFSAEKQQGEQLPHASGRLQAHVKLCRNQNDLVPFTPPGESPLRYRQDSRKVSHEHRGVGVINGRTPQPGHAVNLHAMR
jgi:hypothetical protein